MDDFYDIDGIRFPHTIAYFEGKDVLLAVEKIDEIVISRTKTDYIPADLTH
jgi:hypothetical protein